MGEDGGGVYDSPTEMEGGVDDNPSRGGREVLMVLLLDTINREIGGCGMGVSVITQADILSRNITGGGVFEDQPC